MPRNQSPIIVSACLTGVKCAYDGQDNLCPKVALLVKQGKAVAVCPEVLAGLPTPRPRAEIKEGRVITEHGDDVTEKFLTGAHKALQIAKHAGATKAILKRRSPSCGSGEIFDGTFSKTLVKGNGIFAKLCQESGIEVVTEKD